MAEIYQIDNLDRGILNALMDNARTPYAELAKNFAVSPGTIHVRVEMKQAGIITGARIDVSPKQLGYDVCCFIGIILKSAKDYPSALKKLESLESGGSLLHHRPLQRLYQGDVPIDRRAATGTYQQDPDHRRDPVYRNADLAAEPHYAHHRAITRQIAYPHYPQVDPSRFTAYNAATLSEKVGIVGSWQTLL